MFNRNDLAEICNKNSINMNFRMNTELFISNRLFFDKSNKHFLSQRIIRIALFGIALGLAVMIVSVAVITGFKNEIRNKVIGFGSHIQIINFDSRQFLRNSPCFEKSTFSGKPEKQ